jgi:ribosomal protein L7Ae-like RNA K-turn-binding protein
VGWCNQAYVGSFALYPDSEDTAPSLRNRELTLILMASSADPAVFKDLLRGKKYLEKVRYT